MEVRGSSLLMIVSELAFFGATAAILMRSFLLEHCWMELNLYRGFATAKHDNYVTSITEALFELALGATKCFGQTGA